MHRETSTVISVFVSKHAHREPGLSQCINYVRHLRHETEPSLQTELGALDHRTEIDTDLTPIYLLGLSLCWRKHLFCGVYAHCIYSHARRYLRYAIRVCVVVSFVIRVTSAERYQLLSPLVFDLTLMRDLSGLVCPANTNVGLSILF